MLTINKRIEDNKAVFALEGRLDTVTAPELESAISADLAGLTELKLDFEKLEYVASAGLRVLLSTQKAFGGKGKFTLCNVNETIMEK